MADYIKIILVTGTLYSVPACFLYICFSLVFWGHELKGYKRNIMLFAVLQSFSGLLLVPLIPTYLHFIYLLANFFALFFLYFRFLRWPDRLKVSALAYLIYLLMEFISASFTLSLMPRGILISNPYYMSLTFWPALIVVSILTQFMIRKQLAPGKMIFAYMTSVKKKYFVYLAMLFFLQTVAIAFIVAVFIDLPDFSVKYIVSVCLFTIILFGFFILYFMLKAIAQAKDQAAQTAQNLYVEKINQMFASIRGQRHDFLNHAQVIYSMANRGKIDDLKRYIQELFGEICEVNEMIRIAHPAFAALIQAKTASALSKKIAFRYEMQGLNQLTLGIKSIDLVKIIGNLIDNAFDEVMTMPAEERWVEVKGWMEYGSLNVCVKNPGKTISEEEKKMLFKPGYTTKNQNLHSGIGLSIVKEKVDHYRGSIDVFSFPQTGTEFKLSIPLGKS